LPRRARSRYERIHSPRLQALRGALALVTAATGFLYSIAFVGLSRSAPAAGATLSALFLLIGGVTGSAVVVALYQLLRHADPGLAQWALIIGSLGALGSAVHGGHELALAIRPLPVNPALPNQLDPRGLLTFGFTGMALGLFASLWLRRPSPLPRPLGWLAIVSAVLLVLIYLGRLVVFEPGSILVLGPAALEGFVVNPVFYAWLGVVLLRLKP
jgi:hypothetical protein